MVVGSVCVVFRGNTSIALSINIQESWSISIAYEPVVCPLSNVE